MSNLILGEINLLLATHTTLSKQELLDHLINAVDLKVVITTPDAEKVEVSIGEFLDAELDSYDVETGIRIEEADLLI